MTIWRLIASLPRLARVLAVWGPGLLVMLADSDAGNVVTAAQAGAQWGYRLLPLLLLLIPGLYVLQTLSVRLGIATGKSLTTLIDQHFGRLWGIVTVVSVGIAVMGSLVTEFTGVAGVGELYGIPRWITLPVAALSLWAILWSGSYRRVERVALMVGFLELVFFWVAWASHPILTDIAHQALDQPFPNPDFLYLNAAIIGAVFTPWMMFYQQSATVRKGLTTADYPAARLDTGVGAVLTQLVTAAVLITVAATLGPSKGLAKGLASIGEISEALTPFLGDWLARGVFSAGILGASLVAAIVASLTLAWAVSDLTGGGTSERNRSFSIPFSLALIASALLVGLVPDLVWLNVTAQIMNTVMLPLVIVGTILLARRLLTR